jgi:hypothetical protein
MNWTNNEQQKRFQEHLGIHEGTIHLQNLLIKQLDLSIDTFQMVYLPEWNDFRWTSGWTASLTVKKKVLGFGISTAHVYHPAWIHTS